MTCPCKSKSKPVKCTTCKTKAKKSRSIKSRTVHYGECRTVTIKYFKKSKKSKKNQR